MVLQGLQTSEQKRVVRKRKSRGLAQGEENGINNEEGKEWKPLSNWRV
jgi:hypothetical protein